MYTREAWSRAVLFALGNNDPSDVIVSWLSTWSIFETAAGSGAKFNLLNTTEKEQGSTDFNTAGVQNFVSFSQGVSANAVTLENGYYPNIVRALKNNDIGALTTISAAIDGELAKWGTGRVQKRIISAMGQGLQDEFGGTSPVTSNIPEGWKDDGTTLTAPNGFKVVLGFRDHVLNNSWDATNYPIDSETGSTVLEESNADIGEGTYQVFRKSRLEYTASRGVFEGWLGQEYLFVKGVRDSLQNQVTNDQVLIANLKRGLPKDQITKLVSDCNALLATVQSMQ
jgi:hypothetical protein